MRWLRYSIDGKQMFGIVEGNRVAEAWGNMFDAWSKTGQVHALKDVKVELPVWPRTF